MVVTAAEWLRAYTDRIEGPYVTNENVARALRAAGFFAKPSRGQGHRKTLLSSSDLASFILALAAGGPSDAAKVVTELRAMTPRGTQDQVLGNATLGDVVELFIDAFPGGAKHSPEGPEFQMPNEVQLSTRPYQAALAWYNKGGLPTRVLTYLPPGSTGESSHFVHRWTTIHHLVFVLAHEMLVGSADEAKSTALPGAVLDVDQPHDERPRAHPEDRSGSLNNDDPTRFVCVPATREGLDIPTWERELLFV